MPYYCARDNVSIALLHCMQNFEIGIPALVNHTRTYADNGLIDSTRYMINDRVYVYHGLNDTLVLPGHARCMLTLIRYGVELLQHVCLSVRQSVCHQHNTKTKETALCHCEFRSICHQHD